MSPEAVLEEFARLMHESGREAVEQRKIYRSDLPVKPFAEYADLDDNTKEGRRMMAMYLVKNANSVRELFKAMSV